MESKRVKTSIGTFVEYESPEIIDEEKAFDIESLNEELAMTYYLNLPIGVDTRASKISYFTLDDLDGSDIEEEESELPFKRGIGMTKEDFEQYVLNVDENALPIHNSILKEIAERDRKEAMKLYWSNNRAIKAFIVALMVSAIGSSIATMVDIKIGPVKIIPDYGITVDRIVECVTEDGPTSLNELALSAHTSPNAILYKNGLKTMDEALGKRIKVTYTFEKNDPLYSRTVKLIEGKTYENMELYKIAHDNNISLQTFRDLNEDNTYEHNNGLRFEHDFAIVPCFPTKETQTFMAKK